MIAAMGVTSVADGTTEVFPGAAADTMQVGPVGGGGDLVEPTGPQTPIDLTTTKGIQQALANLGYNPGAIDGIMGPNTKAALMAFQKDAKITVDGVVGPQTRQALANMLGGAAEAPPPPAHITPATAMLPAVASVTQGAPVPGWMWGIGIFAALAGGALLFTKKRRKAKR